MDWYYMQGEQRVGPIGEEEFKALVAAGTVTPATYVWKEDMENWRPYGELFPSAAPAAQTDATAGFIPTGSFACAECGDLFMENEMITYGEAHVCASCKPIFFQRIQEGGAAPLAAGLMNYAGFWIRFGAKFIDGILLGVVQMALSFAVTAVIAPAVAPGPNGEPTPMMFAAMGVQQLVGLALAIVFTTFFLGKFGATPGKMACGIKVVRSDGDSLTYGRAFGRYWGDLVTNLTCTIGYIIAAFDDEKRTLHDRICDTRVIYK